MSAIPIAKTTVEIFCREETVSGDTFHVVFSRTGLPWILAPIPGLHIEQVPIEPINEFNREEYIQVTSLLTVSNSADARLIVRDFMMSGWHLELAMIRDKTIQSFEELAFEMR